MLQQLSTIEVCDTSSFKIKALELDDALQATLMSMGIRVNAVLKVIGRFQRKVVILISEDIRLVLDDVLASKIFVQ